MMLGNANREPATCFVCTIHEHFLAQMWRRYKPAFNNCDYDALLPDGLEVITEAKGQKTKP